MSTNAPRRTRLDRRERTLKRVMAQKKYSEWTTKTKNKKQNIVENLQCTYYGKF
eukprot:UN18648